MSTRSGNTKNKHRIRRTAHARIIRAGILDARRIVDAIEDHPLDFVTQHDIVRDVEASRMSLLVSSKTSKSMVDAYFSALDRTFLNYRV